MPDASGGASLGSLGPFHVAQWWTSAHAVVLSMGNSTCGSGSSCHDCKPKSDFLEGGAFWAPEKLPSGYAPAGCCSIGSQEPTPSRVPPLDDQVIVEDVSKLPQNAHTLLSNGVPAEADEDFSEDPGDAASAAEAQQLVKAFVKNIVKGLPVNMLARSGARSECIVSLDRKLTTMTLHRSKNKESGKKRTISLESIGEIAVGEDVGDDVELPVNELCVTLILNDGQTIAFLFDDLEARDTFALCLSMFVDGRRTEVERRLGRK